jgi:hypothetical protein
VFQYANTHIAYLYAPFIRINRFRMVKLTKRTRIHLVHLHQSFPCLWLSPDSSALGLFGHVSDLAVTNNAGWPGNIG